MPRILHLSDVHYGNDFLPWALRNRRGFRKRPSPEIVSGLTNLIRALDPHFVVISGDFVNQSWEADFKDAAQFLRDLLIGGGIDIQKNVLVIPGNHDVGFLRKQPEEAKRLKGYRSFVKSLYQDPDPDQRPSKFLKRDDAQRLIFLGMDTTLKSLSPRADGEAGPSQLLWARQQLAELKRQMGQDFDRYTKVAVMHHHLAAIQGENARSERYMQLLDAGDVMALLKEFRFDLVLHGHKHFPHIRPEHMEDGTILAIVGAGTVLAPYPDQQGVFGNNLNVIDIKQDVLEMVITRYRAQPNGTFQPDSAPRAFALGRPLTVGYKSRRLRRVLRIHDNGDTEIISERTGFLVTGSHRIRQIPIFFDNSQIPGAEIADFVFTPIVEASVVWTTPPAQDLYRGNIVFSKERTVHDGPVSLVYRYNILKGTIMSISEKRQRVGEALETFEEQAQAIGSDVDELVVELHFPKDYPVTPSVFFIRDGVELDRSVFANRFSLTSDSLLNIWSFRMADPPLRHEIVIRWNLPKHWPLPS